MREMKDSGVPWIGKIPKEWTVSRVKNSFVRKNEKAHQDNPVVLSLARSGVRVRDLTNNEGQIAESYYDYNPVDEGDLLLNPMDLYSGANCSISRVVGVISPAYVNLRYKEGVANPSYYDYYFKTQYWAMAMFAHGKGVSFDNRWTLGIDTLFNYYIPAPSKEEQRRIADFLDSKCAEIDSILEQTKASIEEYKALKQSVITEAVTKGIRGNRPMKDSGVEWIGAIPAEWEYNRLKFLFTLHRGYDLANDLFVEEGGIPVYGSGGFMGYHDTVKAKGPNVVIGRSGSTGKLHFVVSDFWPHNTGIYVSDFKGNDERYVFYVLSALDMAALSTQTAVPTLDRKKIQESFFVFSLDINEQREIVAYLDEKCATIDSLIASKEALITELEAYKKSLIYEYVTGKKEV